ncbi:DNA repair exonuclease [Myriangium duriaei CBS 260.36]|uniref:Double-strand break repair protein n=1 Tax=Myriangium duriaei CBS 260.36 TaxID=1168546 RepID=A0A9P4MM54_9PEZI|nr:DNA repair exonuclease [Myriangium duriaei CBS 260.36]
MVNFTASDTIRVLVATDNHVGYSERDNNRGGDSAKTFDEILRLAKDRDVDMVLLAGDLFHENKPSRKSMFEVMKSLRENCFGEKPCELQMLSDASEVFQGFFNHANYEDPDLNVAIPVFSIHGNHDDPSGEGHFAALDLLQISGLLNYYGRVLESDKIEIKPVLLQKGRTKLALYGMSNVRDERLFRTFRDGKVKFFQPSTQKSDWFNLMSVHQNHHAYTETGYLPENFLPSFMDLVVWGHEHECLIDPSYNPEMGFHVMQPGSSVATSLSLGEAVPKHVAILSISGKEFKTETIRLKSVRPFVMREIVLQDDKEMKAIAKKSDNRTQITKHLQGIVNAMIEEARNSWAELQDELPEDEEDWPKPLIRLRVEYTAPDGGKFDCENPQRFSGRFHGRVANVTDVVQFHRKKKSSGIRTAASKPEMPDEEAIAQLSIDSVKVDELVKEFLTAQSLTILPQNSFGDAVGQFVEKDDNHAVKMFVTESLDSQVKHLLKNDNLDEDDMANAMEEYKAKLEDLFNQGHIKLKRKAATAPRPDGWDSDLDGEWDGTGATNGENDVHEDDAPRSRARNGKAVAPTKSTFRKTSATKKPAAKKATTSRSKKTVVSEDEEDEEDEDDVIMLDDEASNGEEEGEEEEEEESQGLFVSDKPSGQRSSKTTSQRTSATKKPAAKPTTKTATRSTAKTSTSNRQSTLNFSQPNRPAKAAAARKVQEVSDDEISDDDDAFEPAPSTARPTRGRR